MKSDTTRRMGTKRFAQITEEHRKQIVKKAQRGVKLTRLERRIYDRFVKENGEKNAHHAE